MATGIWAALWLMAVVTANSPTTVHANSNNGINMGTTIVAVKSQQGVVVGADTRTSTGTMVSNRFAEKISTIWQDGAVSCVLCRSGSAADTQMLADQVRWKFQERSSMMAMDGDSAGNGRGGSKHGPTVPQMAQWLKCVIRGGDYTASLLCAGYDPRNGGTILSISPSGALLEEKLFAAGGSGSSYILGLMDHALTKNDNSASSDRKLMEEQEAIDFVARLIHIAMARDGSSGGMARVAVMNERGYREVIVPPPGEENCHGSSEGDAKKKATVLKGFQPAKVIHKPSFVK